MKSTWENAHPEWILRGQSKPTWEKLAFFSDNLVKATHASQYYSDTVKLRKYIKLSLAADVL
jgi:hypothetical protein